MYKNIADYIKKNMDGLHGEFAVVVTDMSEREEGCLCVTIHPADKDGETADFFLHPDGSEEYTTIV